MCVQVELSSHVTCPWDAERLTIIVLAGRGIEHTIRDVRAVLIELNTPQPQHGAVCYCGEPIDIPAVVRRGPARTNEAVAHGA